MSENQHTQRLIELLVKKITGTLQAGEEQELLRRMEEDPEAKAFAGQFSPEFLANELALKEEIDTEGEWKKFRGQAGFRTRVVRWRRGWTITVAASLLLIITTGLYLVFLRNDQRNTTVLTSDTVKDIPRPEGKPVLTLADGSAVVLDSKNSGNEHLKGQGILNLSDKELLYGKIAVSEPSWNTVATPRGVSYKLVLPDGTGVWLNTTSSIRFPTSFTGKEREVTVTGETYFEVAKNSAMPFRVHTGNSSVQVLGTSFNIEAWPEKNVKTTLLKGVVVVNTTNEKVRLRPGEQANAGQTIKVSNEIDTEQVLAWKNDQFIFRGNTIQDIMENLARYYDFGVEYRGVTTSSLFVGTFNRSAPLSEILLFLEKTGGVHFRVEGRKVIVMP
ncbi:MAG: FecR domain-containing protein [Chitinophagaceae bacterium]|nr:FecR domain-containing protein [Chitinophagaceae bacterium]